MKYVVVYHDGTEIKHDRFESLKLARAFAKKMCTRNDTWADVFKQTEGIYSMRVTRSYKP